MFAAAISLVGLAATVYLVLREAKAIRAPVGHRCQKRSWVERRLRPVPALFDYLGRHWPRGTKRAARLCDAHPDQRHPHRMRLGQHRPRPHRPARLCVRRARCPRPTGKLARLRGAFVAARSSPPSCVCCSPASLRCWAWRSRPITTLPGSTPCASCSSGLSSPCS